MESHDGVLTEAKWHKLCFVLPFHPKQGDNTTKIERATGSEGEWKKQL